MDQVFVFPNIIRFSWGTVEPFFEKAVKVEWPHDKELEKVSGGWKSLQLLKSIALNIFLFFRTQANAPTGTQSITSFLAKPAKKAKTSANARAAFFTQRNLQDVTDF